MENKSISQIIKQLFFNSNNSTKYPIHRILRRFGCKFSIKNIPLLNNSYFNYGKEINL